MPRRSLERAATLPIPMRLLLRQLPMLGLGILLTVLLSQRMSDIDVRATADAVASLAPGQWLAALALAAISFWAVGRYDVQVHRHLATGRDSDEAGRAGLLAIAIGQTTGLGILTGALVRLRMMPGIGLSGAVRVTLAVSLLFLAGWAVVTAAALVLLPAPPALRLLGAAGLLLVPVILCLSLVRSELAIFGRRIRIPAPATFARLVGLAAVDTIAAGLCFAVLLSPDAGVPLGVLLPAFLVALGAGLVSGTPGGMGSFEVTFLALLPVAPAEPILAGILAWRVVYYAIPALVALGLLARGAQRKALAQARPEAMIAGLPLPSWVESLLARSRRAEAGILRQGDKLFLPVRGHTADGGAVLARTGRALVLLGDPLGQAHAADVLRELDRNARAEARSACLYKAGARLAATARAHGWKVVPVAVEAWVRPATFTLDAPERRQLRRKLRKAESAGLCVSRADGPLPYAEMARVSRTWAEERAGERGFSMGRFATCYVSAQRVYLAHHQGRLVGFLTLHVAAREWTVDLMRSLSTAPEGTMHALVATAIAEAARDGLPRFSLAALTHRRLDGLVARLPRRMRPLGATAGLAQFKEAFAPDHETLYIAARSWPALALAGIDIARAIAHPAALVNSGTDADAPEDLKALRAA